MRKFVLAIVFLPILLILALPASAMLMNEYRLWVFAKQLSEVDELFEYQFDVLATGARIYSNGNDQYCGFRAAIFYRHHETKENIENIKNYLNAKVFLPAKKSKTDFEVIPDKYVTIANGRVAVIVEDAPYRTWFDFRCW